MATISLGGEAGNTQFDAVSHQILVAAQTRNQVVTIDPQSDQVTGRYDTAGCDHPHGLQVSRARRLAFVACEGNAKLVVMDLQTMAITGSFDVGSVPDVLAFDAPRRILYVAAEGGPLTALYETDSGLRMLADPTRSADPDKCRRTAWSVRSIRSNHLQLWAGQSPFQPAPPVRLLRHQLPQDFP